MIGIDALLSVTASATAVIASLQAASRARYLVEHGRIGVKEGPLILPPLGNESASSLWELVQVFQECVQLGLNEADEEGSEVRRQSALEYLKHSKDPEPYSLSPYPTSASVHPDNTEEEDGPLLSTLSGLWPSQTIHKLNKSTNYWSKRIWHWQKSKKEFQKHLQRTATTNTDTPIDGDVDECITQTIQLDDNDNPHHKTTAEITAFAPQTFATLREEQFQISPSQFRRSIFQSGPYISFQSNSKGAARVGGVFFFTRDGAYMIKTIKHGEAQTFLKLLPNYVKHMKRHARHSLLTRFCGMYTVKLKHSNSPLEDPQQYTFVIMNSVFPAEASNFMTELYDLKGSTVGRECSEEEKQRKGPNAVLKDLDLKRQVDLVRSLQHKNNNQNVPYGIHLGASTKSKLLAQLRKDVAFLRDCRVMDYSLLVGIVNMDQTPQQSPPQVDAADVNTLHLSINQEKVFNKGIALSERLFRSTFLTPVRLMIAPPLFFTRKIYAGARRVSSSILTYPLPHYGSSACVVDGGVLSVLSGTTSGGRQRAIYYLGLIDFLQPWTSRKVAENRFKGYVLGYDVTAISCVDPDLYASRFLEFIDAHVS